MFFAFPYFLYGLFLVSIPIALHLINRSRADKMQFSSLLFVRQINQSDIKKLKLKDLILLMLRILFIVCVVLAFSGLHIKPQKGLPGNEKSKTVIIQDDSYSISHDSLLQKQFKIQDELQRLFSDEFIFKVYKSSEILTGEKTDELKPSLLTADYSSIFARLTDKADNIILFSDRQAVNFRNKINNSEKYNPNIILFDVSEKDINNVGISSLKPESSFWDKSAIGTFILKIKNFNNYDVPDISVNIFVNDIQQSGKNISVNANQEKELSFEVGPQNKDYLNIRVSISCDDMSDNLKEDDEAFCSLNFRKSINVGIIGGKNGNNKYLLAAIKSLQQNGNIIYPNVINNLNDNNSYDALMIYDDFVLNDNDLRQLTTYINGGKGIFLFLTMNSDIVNLNKLLSEYINSVKIDRISGVDSSINEVTIEPNHPLYKGIFTNKKEEFSIGNIKNIYSVLPSANSFPIMKLKDGRPVILETNTNAGRLLISTISPDETMSSFAENDIFAPIINRSIFYLSSDIGSDEYNVAGKNNFFVYRSSHGKVIISNPTGQKKEILLSSKSDKNIFSIPISDFFLQKGIYTVSDSIGENPEYFPMNADINEGSILRNDNKDIINYFAGSGLENVSIVKSISELEKSLTQIRKGTDLTSIFLVLGIIFLISEIMFNLFYKKIKR
jgi:hypothetical protein